MPFKTRSKNIQYGVMDYKVIVMLVGLIVTLMSIISAVHEISHKDEISRIEGNFVLISQNTGRIGYLDKQLNLLAIKNARVETRLKM